MSTNIIDNYATTNQAAERLGIHRNSVIRLIRKGRLPAVKFLGQWAIDKNTLEQFASGYIGEVGRHYRPPLFDALDQRP